MDGILIKVFKENNEIWVLENKLMMHMAFLNQRNVFVLHEKFTIYFD